MDLGKLLIIGGALLLVAGIVVLLLARVHVPLGRLPGNIVYRGKNTTVYLPLTTSLLLTVLAPLHFFKSGMPWTWRIRPERKPQNFLGLAPNSASNPLYAVDL